MMMKITPLEEGKTKKGGFFYSVLMRDTDGQQVMKGFYSAKQLPLNKELEVNVRFGRDNIYFIR